MSNEDDSTYAGKYVQPKRGPLGRAYERVRRFVSGEYGNGDSDR